MKPLRLKDIILLNFVAVISLRWLASAGASGPASLSLWLLAGLCFFLPEGLAVAELSSRYPGEGGLYRWTKIALGDYHGFICGWCYWVNNLLYFPGLLLYVSANIAFALQAANPQWQVEHDKRFVVLITIGTLWVVAALSILGMRLGKWVQNIGALAHWVPVIAIVGLGTAAYFAFGSANVISLSTITPKLANLSQLSFFAQICFALAGLELASFFGGEVENPRRNILLGLLISGILILGVYVVGTLGILVSVPADKITTVNGVLLPIKEVGEKFNLPWMAGLCAIALTIGNFGTIYAWFAGAARVPYLVGVDKHLPASFGKLHPRFGTPYVAILVQTSLATLLALFATAGANTGLESAYKVLVDMCLILYFIPYCYLFLSLRKLRKSIALDTTTYQVPGGSLGNGIVSYVGLVTTVVAIATTIIPPDTQIDFTMLAKTFGGTLVMLAVGGAVYLKSVLRLSPARRRIGEF